MEGSLRAGGCSDVATMHVKIEELDEKTPAPVSGSRESPARCGDAACGGGDQLADATTAAVLLCECRRLRVGRFLRHVSTRHRFKSFDAIRATHVCPASDPVSTDRFFATSGDGKTYLKIAPASAMPSGPSEKTLPSGSDFSSKAVLCLIEAVGRRWGLYETRERSQLFQSVQEEMASKGHVLPVEKIRRKWNNLIVTYKRVKDRSRETGHAKTSWEFFDLMDSTLCDTVGTQIANAKRPRASAQPGPLAKIAAKPQFPQRTTVIRPDGDFAPTGGEDSAGHGAAGCQVISGAAAVGAMTPATVSPTNAPELKPLIVFNSEIVASSVHPAAVVPSPSFISSPCFTETASTPPSLGLTGSADLNAPHHADRKPLPFSQGPTSFRLGGAPPSNSHNILGHSSPFPPTSSSLSSSASTSLSATTPTASEGAKPQRGRGSGPGAALFQEGPEAAGGSRPTWSGWLAAGWKPGRRGARGGRCGWQIPWAG
uniref:uncharacterized protein LOC120828213 isoform X1 n=1 Tax=Gasterosteus aculeatus aculeatus TaxID=481459 RepID=UPI001A9950B7|nr:uncharacterized protein LOC120828213 isoform X1 [Gasterosteus aculeatus aculeatus]